MFEAQTFQKYFDKEQAGAKRIALSAGLTGSIGGARVLGQFDDIFLQTDLALDKIRHDHALKRIDAGITQMQREKTHPGASALLQGFAGFTDMFIGGAFDSSKPKGEDV